MSPRSLSKRPPAMPVSIAVVYLPRPVGSLARDEDSDPDALEADDERLMSAAERLNGLEDAGDAGWAAVIAADWIGGADGAWMAVGRPPGVRERTEP